MQPWISRFLLAVLVSLVQTPPAAAAGEPPGAAAQMEAQRQAMSRLAMLDGEWRGPATVYLADGQTLTLTQTERVGSLLGGSVKLVEGRGFGADGQLRFNAFGVISYSPRSNSYSLRSYAMGQQGDFPLQLTPEGYVWSIQAGPALLRYTTTIKDGVWHEVGERVMEGQPPVKTIEMRLLRVGPSAWPQAGGVGPQ